MEQNIQYEDEFLPEILQKYQGKNPFLVPEGYFKNFSELIDSEMKLAHLKANPIESDVPVSYFESFYDNLNTSILIDDIRTSVKEHDFKVPDNYFDSFTEKVLNQVKILEPKKEEKLQVKTVNFRVWAYAVAACSVIAVSVFVFQQYKKQSNAPTTELTLDSLTNEEIEAYVSANIQSFDDETLEIISADAGYFDHISEFESMDLEDAEEMIQLYQ
jgi:hypothetical protein